MKTLVIGMMTGLVLMGTMSAAEVDWRQHNQQARIAQGVGSGQLTRGETYRLERQEAGIRREIRTDRALNGGHLTGSEWRAVNRQENRLSSRIYRDKHNAWHR